MTTPLTFHAMGKVLVFSLRKMSNNLVKALATVLRNRRMQLSLSVDEVAELAGLSEDAVQRFEVGDDECSIASLIGIADALSTSASYLLGQAEKLARGARK